MATTKCLLSCSCAGAGVVDLDPLTPRSTGSLALDLVDPVVFKRAISSVSELQKNQTNFFWGGRGGGGAKSLTWMVPPRVPVIQITCSVAAGT